MLVSKIVLFVLLIGIVGAANNFIINGPLLQSNTSLSMKQFNGTPATAGDFQIGGYWVTFNALYLVETLSLAFVGFMMFVGNFLNLFKLPPPDERD